MQVTGIQIHDVKSLTAESGHWQKGAWLTLGEMENGRFESKVSFFFVSEGAHDLVKRLEEAINRVRTNLNDHSGEREHEWTT